MLEESDNNENEENKKEEDFKLYLSDDGEIEDSLP